MDNGLFQISCALPPPRGCQCFVAKKSRIPQAISPGDHLNVKKGYQARAKIHVKRVFFPNQALYMRNVNRVSNSCKIGLKWYDFLEI